MRRNCLESDESYGFLLGVQAVMRRAPDPGSGFVVNSLLEVQAHWIRRSEINDTMGRKPPTYEGPQQVTRIPPFRPGNWVKVRDFANAELGSDLSGKIRRVKSVTCSINSPEQKRAIWRIHFEDGRCLE